MNEILSVNYDKIDNPETEVSSLLPIEGKLALEEGGRPIQAVYFQDRQQKVIAYLSFVPKKDEPDVFIIENFTNESYRQRGLQDRLNTFLIRRLREARHQAVMGKIFLDNSQSLLNILKMKDPDGKGVLKAESEFLDTVKITKKMYPVNIEVRLKLNEVVASNQKLLDKIIEIQKHLIEFRFGPTIEEIQAGSRE